MKHIHYIVRETGEKQTETVPGENWLRWLYHHPFGKLALHSIVKRKFLSQWYGNRIDTPDSARRIPEFIQSLGIDMDEALLPQEAFKTFNDFFIRELKPSARPVDPDSRALVSPADGKVLAFENLESLGTFFTKGQVFSLAHFLQDSDLTDKYSGATLMIIRLAPVDYHRFHFPGDGRISRSRVINGTYYSVSPYAVKNRMKIYWENKREYSILGTDAFGDILMCEVGATMVGSIVQDYVPESMVKKGEQKGWFKFGGSTVILLFEKDKVTVDPDILHNTRNGYETRIKMGERCGTEAHPARK